MDLFLERVDREQARGGMGGRLHASRLAVALDEPAERVDGQLAEPGALRRASHSSKAGAATCTPSSSGPW